MAYNGYLIKLGGSSGQILPNRFIAMENYSCTPNQRMESKANRAVTGLLHRTTVEHTATKIEFTTPMLTNVELAELNTMLRTHFSNTLERKITIQYYDMETDTYKVGNCYMPDVQYKISRINKDTNTVYYEGIRYAFIEY